ncbi:protein-L-isoaspartate O-methyltransferase [Bosea sp. (in: a-proteobacteria)]|uniref:protein-L-isoaspartate O-methyltransferase family protein n=1 Tax=Bosea sp. (in: a-proteobacteria) TaxID=1871050 RepID=UPI00261B8E38|nr:protein-L-isoaspartate O-methyltransferase [Bosea sp. (in: a-proteobacteria)]MCO5093066.1 protein-L-isoaspartate O-methyltransferase [Bosea sp. (in: a-proteobacteria)]
MSADTPASEGERTVAFLLSLRSRGVRDLALLRAMEKVPRERFAPSRFADLARQDVSVPLPCGQTMTAPHTVADLIGALDMQAGVRVLEVGTGSGYVSALLAAMGGEVVSLERYRSLALAAHERVGDMGFGKGVELRHADGFEPDRTLGRFERILVNGVTRAVPEALLARLSPGGRLVGALRVEGVARRVVVTRLDDGGFDHATGPSLRLPPLMPGLARAL